MVDRWQRRVAERNTYWCAHRHGAARSRLRFRGLGVVRGNGTAATGAAWWLRVKETTFYTTVRGTELHPVGAQTELVLQASSAATLLQNSFVVVIAHGPRHFIEIHVLLPLIDPPKLSKGLQEEKGRKKTVMSKHGDHTVEFRTDYLAHTFPSYQHVSLFDTITRHI